MDDSERVAQRGVIAGSAQFQVFEHEERCLARLSSAQRGGDPRTGCGQRFEAVGLRGEIVELRAVVCFDEVFSTAALEYETAVDATSRDGRRALDAERPRGIRNRGLQR